MFEWLNKGGVRSSDGFEFQFTGRSTAQYREGEHIIELDVEGSPIVSIHNDEPLRWGRGSNLSAEAKNRVLANIKAALEFMELRLWEYKAPFK
jgi:hypothetical protein